MNKGEWPPRDAGSRRVAEARKACEILKARPLYAGQFNSQAVVDEAHYETFRKILEAERPDAVFTHWPIDNHADHRAISMLVYDAWLKMGKRFALYYYEVSNGEDTVQFAPTHYVDITETEPRKRLACYAHASQKPDKYYALQEQVTRMRGSRAATGKPKATSGTCRAPTSHCRSPERVIVAWSPHANPRTPGRVSSERWRDPGASGPHRLSAGISSTEHRSGVSS